MNATIYIMVRDGDKKHLVIDGGMDLFQLFLKTINNPTPCNLPEDAPVITPPVKVQS